MRARNRWDPLKSLPWKPASRPLKPEWLLRHDGARPQTRDSPPLRIYIYEPWPKALAEMCDASTVKGLPMRHSHSNIPSGALAKCTCRVQGDPAVSNQPRAPNPLLFKNLPRSKDTGLSARRPGGFQPTAGTQPTLKHMPRSTDAGWGAGRPDGSRPAGTPWHSYISSLLRC